MATSKGSGKKVEQSSVFPKGGVKHRPINIERMQNVLLIWLDDSIDENSEDCANTITQLQSVVNDVNTYTDGDRAIRFIDTITNNKVCMIISGALGQHIVPRVHGMSQLDSIFIFCGDKKRHKQWVKEWPKIKGIFTEISPICDALKQVARRCEQNAIPISFVARNTGDVTSKTLDRLDPSFMYTQILKEILLTITFEENHIQEFIDYCREQFPKNHNELNNITEFQRTYREQTPIWWYTYPIFLYPMLNRALWQMNVDVIVRIGFFIDDLHRHIQKLHAQQYGNHSSNQTFTVYRGQGLSNEDFEKLSKTKSGLISFNNFLSTSKNPDVSLEFANEAAINPDLIGILFIIQADPSQSTTPFASICDVSYFEKKEDEVLFSMHSVFRINKIRQMNGNNRLYEVELTLTSDNDPDLRKLTDRIREETDLYSIGWDRLGQFLIKMGLLEKAEGVYEVLLGQATNESEKASIYCQLGKVRYSQGDYQEAISFSEKAINIFLKTKPRNQLSLGKSYNCMGVAYISIDNYPKALSSLEEAVAIQKKLLPREYPALAFSYDNIGLVYKCMGDFPKALSSHKKSLEIQQQSLPLTHPDLAKSYGNIGNVYVSMGDYPEALLSHEKALEIKQQSLPPNHSDLAASYNNIGVVQYNMGNYSKARSCYERAIDIGQQSLPRDHPNLKQWKKNLERVRKKL